MSSNFLENIKKDLARTYSIGTRIPAGKELVNSRDIYQLVESYERMKSSDRLSVLLQRSPSSLIDHLQVLEEAIHAAFLHSGPNITQVMWVISRSLGANLEERVNEERIKKGKYDDIDQ